MWKVLIIIRMKFKIRKKSCNFEVIIIIIRINVIVNDNMWKSMEY